VDAEGAMDVTHWSPADWVLPEVSHLTISHDHVGGSEEEGALVGRELEFKATPRASFVGSAEPQSTLQMQQYCFAPSHQSMAP
jgi:hypothetical protein